PSTGETVRDALVIASPEMLEPRSETRTEENLQAKPRGLVARLRGAPRVPERRRDDSGFPAHRTTTAPPFPGMAGLHHADSRGPESSRKYRALPRCRAPARRPSAHNVRTSHCRGRTRPMRHC